jgi:hypothetical protein
MLHQSRKHLETAPVIKRPFIFEKEFEGTILDSRPEDTFPYATGLEIDRIGCKRTIRMTC